METNGEVAALLLAAGGGRRLGGRPKALLPYDGRPLVEHAVAALRAGGCGPVHVVLGAAADEVEARADLAGCVIVRNPHWEEGMGSSLRAGLASLAGRPPAPVAQEPARGAGLEAVPGVGLEAVREGAREAVPAVRDAPPGARPTAPGPARPSAVLIGLVDQPGIGAESVARVLAAARAADDLVSALVSAMYAGRRGHPVLVGAARWAGVAAGAGEDRGARTYLREHAEQTVLVECGDVGDPADIDTPADLRLLRPAAPRATKR